MLNFFKNSLNKIGVEEKLTSYYKPDCPICDTKESISYSRTVVISSYAVGVVYPIWDEECSCCGPQRNMLSMKSNAVSRKVFRDLYDLRNDLSDEMADKLEAFYWNFLGIKT